MAESGHGIAVIPSTLQTHRHSLRIASVTYRGRALREPLAIFWHRKRPLPAYATAFCDMLSAHVRDFPGDTPITTAVCYKKRAVARQASMQRRRS
jgi:DNA-binding transcriptional LysR family regulator